MNIQGCCISLPLSESVWTNTHASPMTEFTSSSQYNICNPSRIIIDFYPWPHVCATYTNTQMQGMSYHLIMHWKSPTDVVWNFQVSTLNSELTFDISFLFIDISMMLLRPSKSFWSCWQNLFLFLNLSPLISSSNSVFQQIIAARCKVVKRRIFKLILLCSLIGQNLKNVCTIWAFCCCL